MERKKKKEKNLERLTIKTHFVNIGESYTDLVEKYVCKHYQPGDILFISEKVISLCQKNIVEKKQVKLGFWAKFLSRFATSNDRGIAMDEPYKLQLAINLAGLPRILLASFCSAVTKLFGKKGVFYEVAGHGISEIDGFYMASPFELYHDIAILSPINPDNVCNEIYNKCNVSSVIVDANDFGVKILGMTDALKNLDSSFLISLIDDNPAGQGDDLTPFILVKQVNKM